jgi:hypothetical protein
VVVVVVRMAISTAHILENRFDKVLLASLIEKTHETHRSRRRTDGRPLSS